MKIPFLDIKRQQANIQDELDRVAHEVINKGWYIGGEYVNRFENAFAKYLGVDHCVSCGSGTDALQLILEGYGIGPGDEVIIPSFTWVSDAEVVHAVGAKPVFADLSSDGFNITAESIAPKINAATKAIIVVHLYGIPCDMEPIMKLAKAHDLKVIEDCAHAHGATYKQQKVGGIGDAGSFSFYPTKNMGALGDGGAVVTNDTQLADRISLLKDHGQKSRDEHLLIGRNTRLDTLQAAFLSLKLAYLDQWNEERQKLAQIYFEGLKGAAIKLPACGAGRVFHLFVINIKRRDELQQHLKQNGITTAIHYPKAIHQINAYNSDDSLPYSEVAANEVLSLPLYQGMEAVEIEYVVQAINKF